MRPGQHGRHFPTAGGKEAPQRGLCSCWLVAAAAARRGFWHLQTSPHKYTAVVSSSADHILVIIRETDVCHVSRVTKVSLMFGKFLCARKIKELHQPKVISCDNVQASVGHTCAVDISFVCISWPDSNDFISQDTVPTERRVRRKSRAKVSCSQSSPPRDKEERDV